MKIDLEIAKEIMLDMAKQGIGCLSIYDSFIVPKSYEYHLKESMNKVSKKKYNCILPYK